MNDFQFNQPVRTPNGKARFIGYLGEGREAQVSRIVPARELSREECVARKPSLQEYDSQSFSLWQATAHFTINEVYAVGQIAGAA